MKILLLHFFFSPPNSYGNNRSYELAKIWMEKYNAYIKVLTTNAYFLNNDVVVPNNMELKVFFINYRQGQNFLLKQYNYLRAYHYFKNVKLDFVPDIIYAVAPPLEFLYLGKYFSEKYDVPLIVELMDLWPEVPYYMDIIPEIIYKYYKRKMLKLYSHKNVKKVVLLSPGYLEMFSNHYPGVSEKGFLSYNGTNTNLFFPRNKDNNDKVKIIYAGALGYANNLLSVIKEMIKNKQWFSSVEFDIYGWGKQKKIIEKIIMKNNIDFIKVHSVISKDELSKVMPYYDIGIVSFNNYKVLENNSANKFYDYLACGLSVAINYGGWQAKTLSDNNCGIFTFSQNNKEFIIKLRDLALSYDVIKEHSINSRRLALREFDREKIAEDLYEKVF